LQEKIKDRLPQPRHPSRPLRPTLDRRPVPSRCAAYHPFGLGQLVSLRPLVDSVGRHTQRLGDLLLADNRARDPTAEA
jgi:hypothetical protein